MERKFKAGDVVKLNSGSPNMTIEYYNTESEVLCTWFDINCNNFKKMFYVEALTLVEKE